MKRALVASIAALIVLTGCSSKDDPKPKVVTTTSAAPFNGNAVAMSDTLDACTLVSAADMASLTRTPVISAESSNSDATPGKAGAGRGCLYQTKVDGTTKTYGQVFFLLVKTASAADARKTFDATFSDGTLKPLANIGDAAGYIGQTQDSATEVDGAALRGALVIVTKCLRTPDAKGKAPSIDTIVAECTVPLLHAVLARVTA